MKKLADRINSIEESKSIGLSATLSDLRDRGEKIIGLNVGEPEFATPPQIIEATKKALDENKSLLQALSGALQQCSDFLKKFEDEKSDVGNGKKKPD